MFWRVRYQELRQGLRVTSCYVVKSVGLSLCDLQLGGRGGDHGDQSLIGLTLKS